MTKYLVYIVCLFVASVSFAQKKQTKETPVQKEWKGFHKDIGYDKTNDYKGPRRGDYVSPKDLSNSPANGYSGYQGSQNPNGQVQPYQGRTYTPRQIQSGKQVPRNPTGQKNGTIKRDPNIVEPEPAEIPEDYDREENQPTASSSSSNQSYSRNDVSWDGWKNVGIVVLILLAIFILYLIVSSIKPGEKTIPFAPLEEDLNPEMISKTELELRLEAAEENGNYKECVRIYFLFAMKELLNRKLLYWKKEKTNMHYIIEMQGKPGLDAFERIVAQYDIVWYGDYTIDKSAYTSILPVLNSSYKELERLK